MSTENSGNQEKGSLLNEEEKQRPQIVLERFFACYHLDEAVAYLKEIKRWVINKDYPYNMESTEHENLAYFFECLHVLAEASYIIEEKRRKEENTIEIGLPGSSKEVFHMLFDKVDVLYEASLQLHRKKQNTLACYLLKKTFYAAYQSLVQTTVGSMDESLNLEQTARICSCVFKGLPNPFAAQGAEAENLKLLDTMRFSNVFSTELKIEDKVVEELFTAVNVIRRDVCAYYENRLNSQ